MGQRVKAERSSTDIPKNLMLICRGTGRCRRRSHPVEQGDDFCFSEVNLVSKLLIWQSANDCCRWFSRRHERTSSFKVDRSLTEKAVADSYGSASDGRERDCTATQLTPAPRGQTADFRGWHWPAVS
jgi:hypothetical protein